MYKIDLNSDLGEGAAFDAEIIPLVTSANIACGFHAGDSILMKKTVDICLESGAALGAHPGYPDKENFGRTKMKVTPEEVYDFTLYQVGALAAFAKAKGAKLEHVKPHGAMYNMAAKDPALSLAIVDAVKDCDSGLILLALSGSEMIRAAKLRGLKYASEVFADRAYEADGTLRVADRLDDTALMAKAIVNAGIALHEICLNSKSLEDYYLGVTEGGAHNG